MAKGTPLTLGSAVILGFELAVELWDDSGPVYRIPFTRCRVVSHSPTTSEVKLPSLLSDVDFTLRKCVIAANVNGNWEVVQEFTLQGNPCLKVGQNLTLDNMTVTFTQ